MQTSDEVSTLHALEAWAEDDTQARSPPRGLAVTTAR